jgi:uncharacterized protein YpmB
LKKAIILVIIILIIAAFAYGYFSLKNASEKVAITPEEFQTKIEAKGLETADVTDQLNGQVEKGIIGGNSDFEIEFYKVAEEDQAIRAYNQNKGDFELEKVSASIETNIEIGNVSKYSLLSNGKFMVISRIQDTFIYVNASDQYKGQIEGILKDLGY